MIDKEYSAFMLLNAPGFGIKSICYVYDTLKKLNLTVSDLFNKHRDGLSELFPELGHGKFSRASLEVLSSLDDDKMYNSYLKLKKDNVCIIGLDDERYPKKVIQRLGENAPPAIFCKGNLKLLNTIGVSIVGSRDVTDFAILLTKRIANRLAENEVIVTSGFAKGVDTNAHIGALESNGSTIMVLSYGFNHLSIKKEIKEYNWEKNALFISQFMPYEKFSGQNAMSRNKLICALSSAVIVISSGPERDDSGKMSGTFDSGLTALKYKIPLFILNPELLKPNPPQGNYDLIKLGGVSLSNGNELLDYLNKISEPSSENRILIEKTKSEYNLDVSPKVTEQSDDLKPKILSVFNGKPLSIAEIIKTSGIDFTKEKLTSLLKKMAEIEIVKNGRHNLYKLKGIRPEKQATLFE